MAGLSLCTQAAYSVVDGGAVDSLKSYLGYFWNS